MENHVNRDARLGNVSMIQQPGITHLNDSTRVPCGLFCPFLSTSFWVNVSKEIFARGGGSCHLWVLCSCRKDPSGMPLRNCSPSTAAARHGAWLTCERVLSKLRASIPLQQPGSGFETQSEPFNQKLGDPVDQIPSVTRGRRDRPRGFGGKLLTPMRRIHGAVSVLGDTVRCYPAG